MLTICKVATLLSSGQLGLHRFRGCDINIMWCLSMRRIEQTFMCYKIITTMQNTELDRCSRIAQNRLRNELLRHNLHLIYRLPL